MINILLNVINRLFTIFTPHQSLRLKTWWLLLKSTSARKMARSYFLNKAYDFIHKPYFIFLSTLLIALLIAFLNIRYSFNFHSTRFAWLNIIIINDQFAKEIISENLTNTGTIVALSFVVIGFLFEIIKERTGRDLEELIKATQLYFALSVSLISLSYMVIINVLKESFHSEALRNLAISSSYLVLAVLFMIVIQFQSLIKLFNSKRLAELSRNSLAVLSIRLRFNEYFQQQSKSVMANFFATKNVTHFSYYSIADSNHVVLNNKIGRFCYDVNLALLSCVLKLLPTDTSEVRFQEIHLSKWLAPKFSVLFYPQGSTIKRKIASLLINPSFCLTSKTSTDQEFVSEREKLKSTINRAAEIGDAEELTRHLDALQNLYTIYFQTRTNND